MPIRPACYFLYCFFLITLLKWEIVLRQAGKRYNTYDAISRRNWFLLLRVYFSFV